MQPRRPPPPVLLLSLWLGLSLALPAAAATSWDREHTDVHAQPPEMGLPRGILQLAARAALHFFNFRAGSPSALRVLAAVQEGRAWVDPQEGCEVKLVFSTEHYNPEEEGEEPLGKCSARVFFKNQKPRPAINVTCVGLIEKTKRQERDYQLYKQVKQLKRPLNIVSIPDSHGHIDPPLRPIWDLAVLGSSYVMWEKTTQFLHYNLVQLSSVKQLGTEIKTCLHIQNLNVVFLVGCTHGYRADSERLQPSTKTISVREKALRTINQIPIELSDKRLNRTHDSSSLIQNTATKTNDDGVDFNYTVLLHEFSTQEIVPCRIHLFWYPGKPLKVQYQCQELQSPEEASGTDEASAMAPTELSNF